MSRYSYKLVFAQRSIDVKVLSDTHLSAQEGKDSLERLLFRLSPQLISTGAYRYFLKSLRCTIQRIEKERERERLKNIVRFGARKSQKSGFRILTYPINRDTRAIYFNCSYRPLEGPSRPSYLFPRHWSPLFTLHSHKSLKISPYLS